MSDANYLELLESLKMQHASFIQQRDQAQINFQQLLGAIFACESLIKKHEDSISKKLSDNSQGTCENG